MKAAIPAALRPSPDTHEPSSSEIATIGTRTWSRPPGRAAQLAIALLGAFAASAAAGGPASSHAGTRPNIVVIYTDDQALDEMGCYGGKVATPHMDRLAREGARFTRYYPSAAVCSPSRYTALTGQYVSRSRGLQQDHPTSDHALILWNSPFQPGDFTVARALREHGYATGMVGKWHNGGPRVADIAKDADPRDPKVASAITKNYRDVCEFIRQRAGFDYVESVYADNMRWIPIPASLQFHNQEWLTRGALDFIQQNAHRPFHLYLAATLPHHPPALESLRTDPRATPAGLLAEPPAVQLSRQDVLRRVEQAGLQKDDWRKSAWAGIAWLDDGIGAVLRKLDELGLTGRTLVILASDNARTGKMTCNLGLAPCLVRWPGRIQAGLVCDQLASNVDLVPTILDACGVPPPAGTPIDGRSWLPLLAGGNAAGRDSLYLEITYTRGVVTRDWKYIATRFPEKIQRSITPENRREYNQEGALYSSGTKLRVRYNADKLFPGYYDDDQLYNLRADPGEQHNLAGDRKYTDVLHDMQRRLREHSRVLPHRFGEFTRP